MNVGHPVDKMTSLTGNVINSYISIIKYMFKNHSIINPRSINKNQHEVTFYNKIPLHFVVNLFITFLW